MGNKEGRQISLWIELALRFFSSNFANSIWNVKRMVANK
jgi:hypothetical protein